VSSDSRSRLKGLMPSLSANRENDLSQAERQPSVIDLWRRRTIVWTYLLAVSRLEAVPRVPARGGGVRCVSRR
jgi:hypothetical protein